MRLPSPGLHCLRCNVPSVRRGIQHLADIGDVRQGGFTRCRLRSRYWRSSVRGAPVGRFSAAVGRQTSPCVLPTSGTRPQIRASPRRRSRLRHCVRCRSGCALATRRVLPGDAAAAAARRPARPLLVCLGIAQARRQAHRRRCRMAVARARTYVLLYIYVLYVLPCSAVMWRACPVCCGTSVLLVESPDNGSGSVASLSCDGVVGANHRHRGIDRGRNGGGFRCLRQRCLNMDGHPIHLGVFVADGGL